MTYTYAGSTLIKSAGRGLHLFDVLLQVLVLSLHLVKLFTGKNQVVSYLQNKKKMRFEDKWTTHAARLNPSQFAACSQPVKYLHLQDAHCGNAGLLS